MSADFYVKRNVGVIAVNHPPVNALSKPTRQAILNCLETAQANPKVEAIVLCGKGRTFPVGADISEFRNLKAKGGISIIDIADKMENSSKPVIAAIHSNCLGGGLELALGCHYRIATSDSKIGFPEVKLGILPGAGGTQRLPRVAGLHTALEWITSGRHYSAGDAAKVGVIDRIVAKGSSIVDAGVDFASSVVGQSLAHRRSSQQSVKDRSNADQLIEKFNISLNKTAHGAMAPMYCLQAVKGSVSLSYAEGIKRERELMEELVTSNQSKAQIYAFFAEREIQKWKRPNSNISYKTAKPMQVKEVAVIGLGTMGKGIVISLLNAGIPVTALEMNENFLKKGVEGIHKIIDDMVKRRLIDSLQCVQYKNNVKGTTNYDDLRNVDFVIEAVFETMKIKHDVFGNLDKVCKPSAILASNTSALDIDEIASATSRPEKVMGMHFFAPAHKMKLLENIFGEKSSGETIATGMHLGKLMRKVTVLVGNCRGFVGNRMFQNFHAEGGFMLEEGSYPMDVDKATLSFGFTMGKFAVNDLSGNDIGFLMRENLGMLQSQQAAGISDTIRFGKRYSPIADLLCKKKRWGLKVGKGWHDYSPKQPMVPIPSKEVIEMIDNFRATHDVAVRRIDQEEILERLLYPLINEGFKILKEGFANSPLDIDMVWLNGYGWPVHTGGPMYYAYTVGLPKLLERIEYYYEKAGDQPHHWQPSKMLAWLAKTHGNPSIHTWVNLWNKQGIHSKL